MMIRFLLSCMVFPCLTGCLTWPVASRDVTTPLLAVASVGQYHFGWKLSGNRAVAPLQMFDDGRRTWLQFPAGQPVPAIFARLPGGDQLLMPTVGQAGLLMLDGVWPQLVMRGGSLQSVALRLPVVEDAAAGADRPLHGGAEAPATGAGSVTSLSATGGNPMPAQRDALVSTMPLASSAAPPVASSTVVSAPSNTIAAQSSVAVAAPLNDPPIPSAASAFQVSPADGTLRAALSRWANTVGWTFAFAHWAVEVDIPIVAAATFALPFEQAVQELVASTELSDQPLRPCFYTNRVLRIVPHTQPCDRSGVGRS